MAASTVHLRLPFPAVASHSMRSGTGMSALFTLAAFAGPSSLWRQGAVSQALVRARPAAICSSICCFSACSRSDGTCFQQQRALLSTCVAGVSVAFGAGPQLGCPRIPQRMQRTWEKSARRIAAKVGQETGA